jgi:hypothetical protein
VTASGALITSLWLPTATDNARTLTSATLDEREGARDSVTLYINGELATEFALEAGVGAKFLRECGLARQS